jgi:hypothetical protein
LQGAALDAHEFEMAESSYDYASMTAEAASKLAQLEGRILLRFLVQIVPPEFNLHMLCWRTAFGAFKVGSVGKASTEVHFRFEDTALAGSVDRRMPKAGTFKLVSEPDKIGLIVVSAILVAIFASIMYEVYVPGETKEVLGHVVGLEQIANNTSRIFVGTQL